MVDVIGITADEKNILPEFGFAFVQPISSRELKVSRVFILTSLLLSPVWSAADWPDFDRPGILFPPSVLPAGVWSLELGLPQLSRTTSGEERLLDSELHSLFRYGLTPHWEVQFEMAPLVRERVKTAQGTTTRTGYSDARVGLRHDASATMAATLAADAVALQAGLTLNTGHADFKASRNAVDLGLVASWALPADGHEIDAMLQWEGTSSESSWFWPPRMAPRLLATCPPLSKRARGLATKRLPSLDSGLSGVPPPGFRSIVMY
ncbi:MAG: transporter [Gammaproteobacteria bacterium]|nr:transporter [Gammaproteobacteria bacterium]